MAKKWSEVVNSDEFQALSAEDKFVARRQYFDDVIAPQVPDEHREDARKEFYLDTSDAAFSTPEKIGLALKSSAKRAANSMTFNLADKAIAAARAGFDSDLDYDKALAEERASTETAGEILGKPSTLLADTAGAVALGGGAAAKGATLVGREAIQAANPLVRLGAATAEGAGYGAAYEVGKADQGFDPVANLAAAGEGAGYGALGGAAGGVAAELLSPAMRAILGKGFDPRVSVDGQRLNAKGQRSVQRALGGDRGDATIEAMQRMGPDTLALNANDDLAYSAMGVAQKGGEGDRIIHDALTDQFGRRSDRILQATDDALGPVGRDRNLILEGADEAIADTRPEYTTLLSGLRVSRPDRQPIADTVKLVRQSHIGSKFGNALKKYEDVANWPTDAHALLNMRNDLTDLGRKYAGTGQAVNDIKRAVNRQLDKATNGEFQKLQDIQATNKADIEAAGLAKDFLNPNTNAREITAALTAATPERAALMREVARDSVDQTIRSTSNDISAIQKVAGRHANASQRENLRRVFGDDAASNLVRSIDSEVKKSNDYASILKNSNTARKQAAVQSVDDDLGVSVPQNVTLTGLTLEAARKVAMKALLGFGSRTGDKARAAIAKVATMDQNQIASLLSALRRAEQVRATLGKTATKTSAAAANYATSGD